MEKTVGMMEGGSGIQVGGRTCAVLVMKRAIRVTSCNTLKYTIVVFDMFMVFCRHNLNFS